MCCKRKMYYMEAKMKHSQKVHEAMRQAFKELLALSPTELSEKLEKREVGPIGRLMQDTETVEVLPQEARYDDKKTISLTVGSVGSQQKMNVYPTNTDADWLIAKAA